MFKKILNILNIDFDIGNTLLLRVWSVLSGGILILIIPVFLSASEQGYYFTFSSIIGMQVFFELGFNFVITQMISHEMAHITLQGRQLVGKQKAIELIYGLIAMLIKWYSVIAILFFVIVLSVGIHFFHLNGSLPTNQWLFSWVLVVLFSAINLFVSPFLSVMEGMGLVGKVAQMRLIQSILGFMLLSCLFIFNFKLNALPAIAGVASIFSLIYIFSRNFDLLFKPINQIKKLSEGDKVLWLRDIFPFQWKIAISWLSGYFIFQLFNPLIFAHQGPVEAGKLGLSLTIFSTILTLSISWVNAKVPLISQGIARGDKTKIDRLFITLMMKSLAFNVSGCLIFISIVLMAAKYNFQISNRLVNPETLFLLLIINTINHIIFSCATYMRAHKTEPLLLNSVVTGLAVGISAFYLSRVSVFCTMLAYLLILMFVCLPWVLILFCNFYKRKV